MGEPVLLHSLNHALRDIASERLAKRSLPAEVYVSDDVVRRENTHIFGHGWIGIGRADRCSQIGDYVATNIAGTEIVIVRGRDQKLKALSNVCTHRGTRLLDPGVGNVRSIVCPFHRWTYALDGSLAGAPQMQETEDFDRSALCLEQFRVQEYHGFMFVCLSPATQDLSEWFEGFDELHQPWPLASLVTGRRREFDVSCNWKLFLDVFNEYYHLPSVHPNSINDTYATPDPIDTVAGQFTTQFGLTKATASLLSEDQQYQPLPSMFEAGYGGGNRFESGTRYTWCFPNMTFAASSDCLWMYDVLPLDSSATRVGMTICFPATSLEHADADTAVERYYRRFDVAIEEDIAVLQRQQAGMGSRSARQGPFSVLEPSVSRFASWYAGQLSRDRV